MNISLAQIRWFSLCLPLHNVRRSLFCLIKEQEECASSQISPPPCLLWLIEAEGIDYTEQSTLSGLNAFFTMCC